MRLMLLPLSMIQLLLLQLPGLPTVTQGAAGSLAAATQAYGGIVTVPVRPSPALELHKMHSLQ